VSTSCSEP